MELDMFWKEFESIEPSVQETTEEEDEPVNGITKQSFECSPVISCVNCDPTYSVVNRGPLKLTEKPGTNVGRMLISYPC